MVGINQQRELSRARTTYIAAARDWRSALAAYITQPPPLESRAGRDLPVWSRDDVQLMLALHDALRRLVDARRTYDRMRSRGGAGEGGRR
ncbi:hypothetical protein [Paractinoplanes rishiriensis]|uniref:hypothetical protein n=1 Tax=Paractinoplanes rishiriensis TaxID=1050105 RepID=UPI0019409F64|nr:hypothetical protein [Actinoplanes rishiriensis]